MGWGTVAAVGMAVMVVVSVAATGIASGGLGGLGGLRAVAGDGVAARNAAVAAEG